MFVLNEFLNCNPKEKGAMNSSSSFFAKITSYIMEVYIMINLKQKITFKQLEKLHIEMGITRKAIDLYEDILEEYKKDGKQPSDNAYREAILKRSIAEVTLSEMEVKEERLLQKLY